MQSKFYFDKPVITFDFRNEFESIDFIKAGVTLHQRTQNEATEAVVQFFSNGMTLDSYFQKARGFIQHYYFKGPESPEALMAQEINKE